MCYGLGKKLWFDLRKKRKIEISIKINNIFQRSIIVTIYCMTCRKTHVFVLNNLFYGQIFFAVKRNKYCLIFSSFEINDWSALLGCVECSIVSRAAEMLMPKSTALDLCEERRPAELKIKWLLYWICRIWTKKTFFKHSWPTKHITRVKNKWTVSK